MANLRVSGTLNRDHKENIVGLIKQVSAITSLLLTFKKMGIIDYGTIVHSNTRIHVVYL